MRRVALYLAAKRPLDPARKRSRPIRSRSLRQESRRQSLCPLPRRQQIRIGALVSPRRAELARGASRDDRNSVVAALVNNSLLRLTCEKVLTREQRVNYVHVLFLFPGVRICFARLLKRPSL